ncbi:hypothetical protein JCM10449v2_002845 [Rhodotorula kratochvilovae]
MDTTITIRTADDPPVELTAARSGTAKDGVQNSFDVDDPVELFQPFLRLLGVGTGAGDPFDEMGDLEWVSAARLADKYDSPLVRALCKGKYWELKATGQAPITRFFLLVDMDEPQMLKETALEVLPQILDKKGPASSIIARLAAPACPVNLDPDGIDTMLPVFDAAWHQAMSNSMARRFDVCPLSPFCAEAQMQMESAGLSCGQHTEFRLWLRGFEQRYRDSAPDFPL